MYIVEKQLAVMTLHKFTEIENSSLYLDGFIKIVRSNSVLAFPLFFWGGGLGVGEGVIYGSIFFLQM